ncbi:MAG: fused MFS/spermidine synthase [Proteobacteria bacterium]|nr:fused MFS/spermidine synthase [Pseudomonadota bacterium]
MKIMRDNFCVPGFLQSVLFVSTILTSAFLLFWAQPLFAKMILPILGGSSSVWTTSMLFFQFTLLAGYAYAHFSGKLLAIKSQILLHFLLLGIASISLPFYIDHANFQSPEGSPTFWVLSIAAFTVGAPFFMVSATAPMLQRWFSLTSHENRGNPYFLYAASNLGSMAALLCFPTILEPSIGVRLQTSCWQTGYFVLQLLLVAVGLVTLQKQGVDKGLSVSSSSLSIIHGREISASRRLSWVFLAFVPSSMMLGLTSHVTTDIAPVAMFWIIPLALYLFSFVVAFSRCQHLIPNKGLAAIILLSTSVMLYMRFEGYDKTLNTASISVILNLVLFFSSAWLFHGYLSSSKPSPAHLTEFYLWVSIGGMLGGFFNALLAPLIFNQIYEYYVVVVAVFFITLKILLDKPSQPAVSRTPQALTMIAVFAVLLFMFLLVDIIMSRPITAKVQQSIILVSLAAIVSAAVGAYYKPGRVSRSVVTIAVVVGVLANVFIQTQTHSNILLARSFYGALKVKQKLDADDVPYHLFIHGGTRHNLQKFGADVDENQEPLMYFHRQANIGHAVSSMKAHLDRMLHLGFVGLGAGAMSAYVEVGDTATYYEIDPEVVAMAQNREYFSYCSEAKGSVEILVGDARLQLKKAADSSYDMLLIDAFSSDAIPVHLLTAEAVELYLRKIKEDGLLLFHLSNRYLDLHKVLQGLGLPSGYVLYYASKNNVERPVLPANGISGIFSHSQVALIARPTSLPVEITASERWQKLEHDPKLKAWTDDFSNVFGVFRLGQAE